MAEYEKPDILKLAELLKPPEEQVEEYEHVPKGGYEIQRTKKTPESKVFKTIEEFEAQADKDAELSCTEDKKQPECDIIYRQSVTAEDVFLQIGPKTPSSACCEDMVVTIKLADEVFSALDLQVTATNVKLEGFLYKLDLDLPHSINPNKCDAKWNAESETLTLTLRLVREFDFVNF